MLRFKAHLARNTARELLVLVCLFQVERLNTLALQLVRDSFGSIITQWCFEQFELLLVNY
jgi:hypothetical protein